MTQLYECEFCGTKSETDSCPKCKADFDSSIGYFLDKYVRAYDAKYE